MLKRDHSAIRNLALAALLIVPPLGAQPGTLDPSFDANGWNLVPFDLGGDLYDFAYDVAIQPDGKVVVAGEAENDSSGAYQADAVVVRLLADGGLDTAFGSGGRVEIPVDLAEGGDDGAQAVAVLDDGKILVAGSASDGNDYDWFVLRLEADGDVDPTFGTAGRVVLPIDVGGDEQDILHDLLVQPDGKIVLGGSVRVATGDSDFQVTRLLANGAVDTSFGSGGSSRIPFDDGETTFDSLESLALQADGKIVAAGSSDGSDKVFALARWTPTGGPDVTFGSSGRTTVAFPSASSQEAYALGIQGDGGIVVAGLVKEAGGDRDFGIVRLLSTGSPDPSFGVNGRTQVGFELGGTYELVRDLEIQADGRILLAGSTRRSTAAGTDGAVARLLPDGSLDSSFGTFGGTVLGFDLGQNNEDSFGAMALRDNGTIVVVGGVERASAGDHDFVVVQLTNDVPFFFDGFESGDLSAWAPNTP